MKYDPKKKLIDKDIRLERTLERLGTRTPRCIHCGDDRPHCLEAHHIAGRKFDDDTVIVCRNCHRDLSDVQKDHPRQQTNELHIAERIGHYLLGLADLLRLVVERFEEFGRALIELAIQCQTAGIGAAK